jgi:hypothetical protein
MRRKERHAFVATFFQMAAEERVVDGLAYLK